MILVDLIPLPIIGPDVGPSCLNIDTVSIRGIIYIETKSEWVGLVIIIFALFLLEVILHVIAFGRLLWNREFSI